VTLCFRQETFLVLELMVEPMPKVVKPLTELAVKSLKPRVMSAGKNLRSIWTAEYLGVTRTKLQKNCNKRDRRA
jgi:hypothetical protein